MSGSVFNRILVGWDASAGAIAGLRLAIRLTADEGARLTALAVVPGYDHLEDHDQRRRAAEQVRTPLQQVFDKVVDASLPERDPRPSLQFVQAPDVAQVLDGYARTHPIDLVVVGLHGREGLLHPRMGHVASHAVRSGSCPVLVMPDPDRISPVEPAGSKINALFHPFRHRENSA